MLSPFRVVEISSERTSLCGQILADLGATVTTVEPASGSNARRIGPWFEGRAETESSLYWWAFNRKKRSVTLDLETADCAELLRHLCADADFLVEGTRPGWLAEHGLSYQELSKENPGLIVVSITPFGQTGHLAGAPGTDLSAVAASGALNAWGDADRAPVGMSIPQAFLHAGVEGALGALIALYERASSRRGQQVDASAQAAMTFVTQSQTLAGLWNDTGASRNGGGMKFGDLAVRFTYPCKDGFAALGLFFGTAIGPASSRLMKVVWEEGFCDEVIRDKDWVGYMTLLASGEEPMSDFERAQDTVAAFTMAHTKAELYALAKEQDLLIAPVSTAADLRANGQLSARNYWHEIEHPELSQHFAYPGPFANFSKTPIEPGPAAPTLGRDNHLVYHQELGISEAELNSLKAARVI